jgi:hypothetical protein
VPVLVTGERLYGGRSEAKVMQAVLEREHWVPGRWVENEARNTHENTVIWAKLLHHEGISRVLIVSHGVNADGRDGSSARPAGR